MTDPSHQPADSAPRPPPPPPTLAVDARPLASRIAVLRGRAASLERQRFALYGVAGALGLVFVALVLVLAKQDWARTFAIASATLSILGGIAWGVQRGRKALHDDDEAARTLGRIAPGHESDLLSAVQLEREASALDDTSRSLVRAHLARMSKIAESLDERTALSTRPVKIASLVVTGLAILHALVGHFGSTRVKESYRFLWLGEAALESSLFAPEPIAGDVTLTYRYPAHMARPPRTVPGTAGDILAPKGTVVELTARADRDVAKAFAVVGTESIALVVKGRELSGTILVKEPGEWRLRYAKESGRVVAEGPSRPIAIEPDQFPEIKLQKPEQEIEVEHDGAVTLEYAASDDYGLGDLELVYSFGNGAAEQRKKIATWTDAPRRQRGDFNWDLAVLDLKPGDRITYRLEVIDNDAVSGPKRGASASHVLKVFSETEHHREILKKVEELWERLVSLLGDRLEERDCGDDGDKADAEWAEKTGAKDEQLTGLTNDLRKLAKELVGDKRAPQEIARALAHVGDRVATAVTRTSTVRKALVGKPSANLARAFRASLNADIDEEEKGVLYLEDLIDRRKMLDLAELAREMQQGREELKRLIEQYKQAPSEEAKQRLMSEVARLKERLADIHKRMRELQKGISDEHMNEDADRLAQGGDDMMSDLDDIQQQLAKGDTDKALESLEKLQKSLEKMEQDLRERAGEVDDDTKELTRKLQRMASDLMDVQAEQKALREQTESMREREREAQRKRVEQLGKEFIEKQKERVKKARQEMQGMDHRTAEQLGLDDDLMSADDRLAQLEKALESRDFDEALEQAKQAVRSQQGMKDRLEMERETSRRFKDLARNPLDVDDGAERVNRASRPVNDVQQDLEKLMRSARQPATAEERQKMREMSQRQNALQKRTGQLQQQLDEIGRELPIFGPGQQQMLREAAQRMGEATGKLGEGEPRGASGKQQDALQKLQAFKEAMQQQQQQQKGSGNVPMPFGPSPGQEGEQEGDGEAQRNEKVEIPGADQDRAPAEFREELMKAMKDETPERYRERVRNYYEELVK